MKDWFAKNEETITRWAYRAIVTMFAVNSVCDIVVGNASGALGWACACLWCLLANLWRELAEKQDGILKKFFGKIIEAIEKEKREDEQ